MSGLEIRHGSIVRYGREIVRPATLQFEGGRCIGLIGLNGAGKSTWLYGIAGLIPDTGVAIRFGERPVESFGLTLQHPSLPEWVTVGEVLQLLVRPAPSLPALVERWPIGPLLSRKAGHLSKGETQLIASIIALESRAALRCFDEPFAALDLKRRRDLIHRLVDLRRHSDAVTILTAQVASDLFETCTDILMLRDGQLSVLGPVAELSAAALRDPRVVFEERLVSLLTE